MLDAQAVATQIASLLLTKLVKVPAAYRDLADQARRAATSIPLNIAEASGRTGKDRGHHFRIAYGSAQGAARSVREADAREASATSLEQLLGSVGVLASTDETLLLLQIDRLRAMLWRLAGR